MADIVNIYDSYVYQHNRKKKCENRPYITHEVWKQQLFFDHTSHKIYQSCSQNYKPVFHITYVACVNFIHEFWIPPFKFDSERQIFWEAFHGKFIYFHIFCLKSAERKSKRNIFSYIRVMWYLNEVAVV